MANCRVNTITVSIDDISHNVFQHDVRSVCYLESSIEPLGGEWDLSFFSSKAGGKMVMV